MEYHILKEIWKKHQISAQKCQKLDFDIQDRAQDVLPNCSRSLTPSSITFDVTVGHVGTLNNSSLHNLFDAG